MSFHKAPVRGTESELVAHTIRLTGTGASAPTVTMGAKHVSVARNGIGDYTLTWRDKPGVFVSVGQPGLQADVPANVKNCDVTPGAYSTSAKTLQLLVWTSAGAARELAAAEYINLVVWFKDTGV